MFNKTIPPALRPPNTVIPGYEQDPYPWSDVARFGGPNPSYENEHAAMYGHVLSGVEDVQASYDNPDADWDLDDTENIYELEEMDDTYGSGIFDPDRRPGTANTDMGVFASHDSLPGYLARETPFTVSEDVSSLPSGAPYVSVPAGGMAYIEAWGRPQKPRAFGPVPRPFKMRPSPPTGRKEPYAYLNTPGNQLGPAPPDQTIQRVRPKPGAPMPYFVPRGHEKFQPTFEVQDVPMTPAQIRVRERSHRARVPTRSMIRPMQARAAIGALEMSESSKSWITWGAVGLALGAAGAFLLG